MTTTSSALALLAAIEARPDDDTPRLLLADEIEAAGQEQLAAFIRVQIEINQLDMSTEGYRQLPMGVGREELIRREEEALCGLAPAFGLPNNTPIYLGYYEGWSSDRMTMAHIHRGFVETVRIETADFLKPEVLSSLRTLRPRPAVVLGDKEPGQIGAYSVHRGKWWWRRQDSDRWPACSLNLVPELFDRLGGEELRSAVRFRLYPSRSAALDALARAAGRVLAEGDDVVGK